MKELWELFKVFAQIGVLTFGGGYAMLPMIQEEIVDKRGWATDEEILDYYAIGQSTPGIISVNTATFIGYKRKGILGAIVATLGIVFPSIVIITVIAIFFDQFEHYQIVQHAFAGIRVAVAALILNAIISMWQNAIKDYLGIIIFLLSFAVVAFLDISPIWVVIISFLFGVIFKGKKVDVK